MNKFLSLTAFSFCIVTTMFAQPTLTAASNNPVVGDVLFFHACDTTGVNMGTTGASVTWNFASLSQTGLDTTTYVSCPTTPYCDSFPGSNIAATDQHGNYSYYVTNSGALSYLGYQNSTTSLHYTNPIDYIYFPLSYNSQHTDTGVNTFTGGNITYIDSFKCDGYGTLILPSGTYYNVLRIHETQNAIETYLSSTYYWRSEYYLWYIAGTHAALCYMGYDTTGTGSSHISYVGYTSRNTTAVPNVILNQGTFNLFPNPAYDALNIETDPAVFSNCSITNYIGAVVMQYDIRSAQTTLDIKNLPPGLYYFKITGASGSAIKKFVKI